MIITKYAIHSEDEPLREYPSGTGFHDLTATIPECYSSWQLNQHHWTTSYVYSWFIPRLFNDLKLPFKASDWRYIKQMSNEFDISYHTYINDDYIQIYDYLLNKTHDITISRTVLSPNYTPVDICNTDYHRLFICSHRTCHIENPSCNRSTALLLNTDSMSIPVIVYLLPFFKHILIVDNRTSQSYKSVIHDFMKSHELDLVYMELFIAFDYNNKKYIKNIL